MKYYIKERNNGQSKTYYVAEGQLSKKDAAKKENTLAGTNNMLPFETESEYLAKIEELKLKGFNVSNSI